MRYESCEIRSIKCTCETEQTSDKETLEDIREENARPTSAVSLPRYADTGLGVDRYSAVEVEEPIDLVDDEGGTL
jgi:hypothetical protein